MTVTKRIISLITILMLCMSICACGKAAEETVESTPEPTPTERPEYLWTTEFTEIEDQGYSLTPLFYTGEGFYACGSEKTGEEIPDEVIRKAEKEGEEVVNDGRYDVYEIRLCFVSPDGTVTPLDRYEQLPAASNKEKWKDFDTLSAIGGLSADDEGNIYTLEYTYACGNSYPDNEEEVEEGKDYKEFSTKWYLRKLRSDGKELSKTEIKLPEGLELNGYYFRQTGSNFVVESISEGVNGLALLNMKGEVILNTTFDGTLKKLITLNTLETGAQITDKNSNEGIYRFSTEDGSLEKIADIPNDSYSVSSGSGEYEFTYSSAVDFYGFLGGESKELFNWSAVNVNKNRIASEIIMKNSGECFFMTSDGYIANLKRIVYDESLERTALKLATVNPSNELIDAVSEFNRSHYTVRIDIEDYSSYTDGETGEQALKNYVYNHLGGKMPDIIDVGTLPYATMAAEGLFEDLYQYIDSDSQLGRSDFFSNILVALEVDGQLCCTCAGFNIDTVMGSSDVVGDKVGWSYERYYNALSSLDDGSDGFDSFTTRSDMLRTVLAMDLDSYINWTDLTCNFTDGNFDKLLEFVKTFPETVDYASYSTENMESTDMRIREGKQMLLAQRIYGFEDFLRAGYEFEDDVTFIGYPTAFGTGNTLNIVSVGYNGNLAMSSTCADKEAAWEFLRTFFTQEYQMQCDSFPTNVNVFNTKLSQAMETEPVLSKKGEQLYDDEGQPRIYAVGTMYLSDYTAVPYYPLTESQAEGLKELINTCTKVPNDDETVYNIVLNAMNGDNPSQTVQDEVTAYLETLRNSGN